MMKESREIKKMADRNLKISKRYQKIKQNGANLVKTKGK